MSGLIGWLVVWIISAVIIELASYVLPGVRVKNFGTALIVSLVLGFVNIFIRPFLAIFALPITILTLGLFSFVINALMILLTAAIVPAFEVDGFWNALGLAIIIAIERTILLAIFSV